MTIFSPTSLDELTQTVSSVHAENQPVRIRGAGTHCTMGNPVPSVHTLSTLGLYRVLDWEPADLTLVAEAGIRLSELEQMVNREGQTTALVEVGTDATLGGTLAVGLSGYRRLRYGPVRNQVLQTTVITGEGKTVTSGARVVKSVAGYDLSALMVGGFGALGVIGQVCLKLWPQPKSVGTIRLASIPDPADISGIYQPLAVLVRPQTTELMLAASSDELMKLADRLGGEFLPEIVWPGWPSGSCRWSIRVPPKATRAAIAQLPSAWDFVAELGVGHIRAAGEASLEQLEDIRDWTESNYGRMVLEHCSDPDSVNGFDPWGTPPPGLELSEKILAIFDPRRILNRGILPGGI